MDRKLIEYLPEYLREYVEEKAALEAVEPEFDNIWQMSGMMLKEAFILTEALYGASRWEKILALRPKDTDSLETRNLRILAKINEMLPYTMTTLRRFLDTSVGAGNYEIYLDEQHYLLDIQILSGQLGKVKSVMEYVEQITPVNLVLLCTGKQTDSYRVDVQTEACFTARGDFYPRYNLAYLFLDGTWDLEGGYSLSGYKSDEEVDFYPVSLGVMTGIRASPKQQAVITIEKDLWLLDGSAALDGSRVLDAERIDYEL